MSCPGVRFFLKVIALRLKRSLLQHPFAAGITLAGFTAKSTDEYWLPTFIQSDTGSIHKVIFLRHKFDLFG
jgi:hypothetical protein